jgi:hypothetical protein
MRTVAIVLCFLAACSESPDKAAGQYNVQISDGFRTQAGVLVTSSHVLTVGKQLEGVDNVGLLNSSGERAECRVLKRDAGLALIYIRDKSYDGASLGQASTLAVGATLSTLLYPANGAPVQAGGTFVGWRYHEKRAYLQTTIDTGKDDAGAGVYDANGKVIGLVAFSRGAKLTFVLPIEYAINGENAPAAHPDTNRIIGSHSDDEVFAKERAEAAKHPDALPNPITYQDVTYDQHFSKTALVGALTLLAKKGESPVAQPVAYQMFAVNAARERRVLAEGNLAAGDVKWAADAEQVAAITKTMTDAYGEAFAAEAMGPYDVGAAALPRALRRLLRAGDRSGGPRVDPEAR